VPSSAETSDAVVFSRDGRFLSSHGDDDAIYRWDVSRITSAAR